MSYELPKERWCVRFSDPSLPDWCYIIGGSIEDVQIWWDECTFATEADAAELANKFNKTEGRCNNYPMRFI